MLALSAVELEPGEGDAQLVAGEGKIVERHLLVDELEAERRPAGCAPGGAPRDSSAEPWRAGCAPQIHAGLGRVGLAPRTR
jgi:hypothetical protein